jgi:hypothetical protein
MKLTVDDDGDILTFAMGDDDVPIVGNVIACAFKELQDALEEERAAKRHIVRFSKAFGPEVWLGRHPSDVEKVERLRRSRQMLRVSRLNFDWTMRHERAEGEA